jgi:DNA-binding transcriptional LysR family regulator
MPELGHLRAFIAVAEERNFTRAAERLHLAQQAVSKSVATLESQLGVRLLRRTTRDVSLTAAGETLLRFGSDALQRVDAAFAEASAHGQALTGTLHIGVTPAVGTAAHPRIAAALTTDAPKLQVVFHELRPPEAGELLRRRELDIVVSRIGSPSRALGHAELAPSPAIAIVAPGHRLAGRMRIATRELDGETLQTWSAPGDPYTDELVARLAACGARVQVAVATVIGGGGPPTLTDGQFALRPAGWPVAGAVALELEAPGLELPLWVHWSFGAVEPNVDRLRDHLA